MRTVAQVARYVTAVCGIGFSFGAFAATAFEQCDMLDRSRSMLLDSLFDSSSLGGIPVSTKSGEVLVPGAFYLDDPVRVGQCRQQAEATWKASFRSGENAINAYKVVVSDGLISWLSNKYNVDASDLARPYQNYDQPYNLPDGRRIYVTAEIRDKDIMRWVAVFRPPQI